MAERPLQLVREADRPVPWDADAEIAVLGAVLLDGAVIDELAAMVGPEHFYREAHRRLFRAAAAIVERGDVVDPVTVQAEMTTRGEWRSEFYDLIVEAMHAVPTAANAPYHARIVRDAARRRQLIDVGTQIVRSAFEPDGESTAALVDRAERLVAGCAEMASGDVVRIRDDMFAVVKRMEELAANPGALAGASWGLPAVDDMTAGLHPGDLVVVAARPSMGKTAFVTGPLLHQALTEKRPVLFMSLEMSRHQVLQRMICAEALVDLSRFLRGQIHDDEYGRIGEAVTALNAAPIYVDDTGALSMAEARAKARRVKQQSPDLALVVFDYIQLMRGGSEENRTQEVSAISRGLKSLAKELDVPVIALSQLSRAPENRSNHRPQLSDLRESGSIEQDADVVAFLYREEYYLSTAEAREKSKEGAAELIISKQRNGPTGTVDLYFRKECARFEAATNSWGNR